MNVAFRKVWRELWNNKGRTLLVVCSIGVGVLAVGMVAASNAIIARQLMRSQTARQPSNVVLALRGLVDDDTLRALVRLPGVVDADGVASMSIRWKPTLDAEWQSASMIALDDYEHQKFDLVELRSGVFPTSESLAVEFNHVAPYGLPPNGSAIYFEVNHKPKAVILGGTVRDPGQSPPPLTDTPTFYATRAMLTLLGGWRDYSRVRFTIPDYTKQKAEATAAVVEERLKKIGVTVESVQTQDPRRHAAQDILDGVALILDVMAVLSLGLSVVLVVNTINALITQQVPQIGIMKTVGGLNHQIATLYLAGVTVYGLLSLAFAVPIGAWGGVALAQWMLRFMNVPASTFEILPVSLLLQIFAGLLAPLGAALWPIAQGASISVREALNAYGLGTGRYGTGLLDRLLGRLYGLPRMATLALRNTFRRLGRVAMTEITLIAAGAVFLMIISTQYSFDKAFAEIFGGFGYDVLVGFDQAQRIDKIVPMIESRPNVTRAEMWVWYTAKGRKPGDASPGGAQQIFLRGIPADTQLFKPELTAGRNLDPRDDRALLLNQKIARDLGLGVGQQIELDFGEAGTSQWTIVGLLFDLTGRQTTAYVLREPLNLELRSVGRASVAEIRGAVKTLAAQEAIESDLRAYFESQGISVSFIETALKSRQQASAQFSILTTLLLIMTILIAIVGSVGLSGTLSINVLERRREIGVMRAVGASSLDVAFIFMSEGLLLGVVSWVLSAPLSLLAGRYFVEALGQVVNFPAVYYYSFTGLWLWLTIVVVLSLLASGLPARRATQISVRESLAYE
jgi:putative ABC transport system permease protein